MELREGRVKQYPKQKTKDKTLLVFYIFFPVKGTKTNREGEQIGR